MRAKWIIVAISLFFLTLLFGCGGNSVTPDTNFRVDIYWAERGRAIQAPAAALSCKISLYPVTLLQTDHDLPADSHNPVLDMNTIQEQPSFQWIINRQAAPGAYLQHWVSPDKVPVRRWRVVVDFTSEANNTGSAVANASIIFDLKEDGTGLDTISLNQVVKSLEVQNQQTIAVGEHKALAFIARDAAGAAVAVTPGSVKWEVGPPEVGIAGARPILPEMLRFQDGQAYGLAAGSPTVRVSMDGMVSPWVTVTVRSTTPVLAVMDCILWRANSGLGDWIFFAAGSTGNMDIYRVKPDGSEFGKFVSVGARIQWFDISSDYRTIVYEEISGDFWATCHIMKMNSDGSGSRTELVGPRSGHPVFMNDNTVLFEKSLGNSQPAQMYTIPIGGGEMTHIPNNTQSEEQPNYFPATGGINAMLTYVEAYNGNGWLWVKNADGSNPVSIAGDGTYGHVFHGPCFAANTNKVLTTASHRSVPVNGGIRDVMIVDVETKNVSYPYSRDMFTTVYVVASSPFYGYNYCFTALKDGVWGVYTDSLAGGELKRIYPAPEQ